MGEPVFRGSSYLNLDAKGRLAIPAKQRERLSALSGSSLVATIGPSRCLLLFPATTWELVEHEMSELSTFDEAAVAVKRLYLGHAEDLEMDAQGRILIPQHLRDIAKLDRRVVLVGQGAKLELWDEQQWKDQTEANLNNPKIGEMANQSLGKFKF